MNHKFVDIMPDNLADGVLYISIKYATAIHLCACGCKNEVVTPLSPTDWQLIFDGKTVSLYPSIGNWSFKCQSHYFIKKDEIIYARTWTKNEIKDGRIKDKKRKSRYYNKAKVSPLAWLGLKIEKFMAKKVTSKKAASSASKVLKDGRTGRDSKTAAGSALSQREPKRKNTKKANSIMIDEFHSCIV